MNSAIIPAYKTHVNDPYIWFKRHSQIVEENRKVNPELILIGDSLTHYWGGNPSHDIKRGEDSYNELYGRFQTVNMGFGFDRTEHVLWRVQNGEIDEINPKVVQLLIGANNLSVNTPEEIAEGVQADFEAIHSRLPNSKILLFGIVPQYKERDPNVMEKIFATNALLQKFDGALCGIVIYGDPGKDVFWDEKSGVHRELFVDGTHPNDEGYRRFAKAIRPFLNQHLRS